MAVVESPRVAPLPTAIEQTGGSKDCATGGSCGAKRSAPVSSCQLGNHNGQRTNFKKENVKRCRRERKRTAHAFVREGVRWFSSRNLRAKHETGGRIKSLGKNPMPGLARLVMAKVNGFFHRPGGGGCRVTL